MDGEAGWELDKQTLRPRLLDPARVAAELAHAGPVERLQSLAMLGRLEQGLAEASMLLRQRQPDPWPVLVQAAQLHRLAGEATRCEQLLRQAWPRARSRNRQALTLHQLGLQCFDAGQLDQAAAHLELACTLQRGFDPAGDSELALRRVRQLAGFDAIVLAGGTGVRLGGRRLGAKALIRLAGWPLADHVLLAASAAGTRIQVGPSRVALADPVFVREDPAGAGPVAAIAAGLPRVQAPLVAVLAGDLPFVGPALASLRQAAADVDAAALVDPSGRTNYLAAVWRTESLRAALAGLDRVADAPMRALYAHASLARVPDFDAASADVDTPADLMAATERIRPRSPVQLPEALLAWPGLALHAPS
ncbi:MAG TPA: NTP transferase domain-containing protein [Jatrophihabitans sp.]|nr:NTP transferase domain-containing protein [Jatrophihabitans sp.]